MDRTKQFSHQHDRSQGIAWDEGPQCDDDEVGYQAFVYCHNVGLASF